MQHGDFILIEYEGRVKATGEVFASTKQQGGQQPAFAIVGERMVVPGVDAALRSMAVGEERTVDVPPTQGFGERNPNAVKILSISKFRENKIEPSPGDVIEIDGMRARVLSVSGGRVRTDFNHPLAGRELEYTLKIASQITDPAEKLRRMIEHSRVPCQTELKEGKAVLTGPTLPDQLRTLIEQDVKKRIPEIATVTFVEANTEPKAGHPESAAETRKQEREDSKTETPEPKAEAPAGAGN